MLAITHYRYHLILTKGLTEVPESTTVNIQRYVITGILTIIPLWITYLVFDFFLSYILLFWKPWVMVIMADLQQSHPDISAWFFTTWFQTIIASILTLIALYILGWAATRVIGKRILGLFDQIINKIPVAQSIYGSVKKLIAALRQKPNNLNRVVLIAFPSPEMRTVGFVTHTFNDSKTGDELAAVYVPTTPNPTSGYMEIVPADKLIATNWTMDEAMTFVLTAGSVAPENISLVNSK